LHDLLHRRKLERIALPLPLANPATLRFQGAVQSSRARFWKEWIRRSPTHREPPGPHDGLCGLNNELTLFDNCSDTRVKMDGP
jgi:hypothetical protein